MRRIGLTLSHTERAARFLCEAVPKATEAPKHPSGTFRTPFASVLEEITRPSQPCATTRGGRSSSYLCVIEESFTSINYGYPL